MTAAKELVERLLAEEDDVVANPRVVRAIVGEVEQYLGDVIDQDTSDEDAAEECWTLCIDKANDMIGRGPKATAAAKAACAELGYSRE